MHRCRAASDIKRADRVDPRHPPRYKLAVDSEKSIPIPIGPCNCSRNSAKSIMDSKYDEKVDISDASLTGVPAVELGQVLDYPGESAKLHHGELRRSFKTRHIQMICLGGCIGSGIFISTGKVSLVPWIRTLDTDSYYLGTSLW